MRVAIGEAHHLVFDRRTVARADPLDDPGIHWAAIEVIADHLVGLLVGIGDPAGNLLRMLRGIAHEREDRHRVVAMLRAEHRKIDSARVNARRRTGFQTADAQRQRTQTLRQRNRRRIACATAAVVIQPDMNFAVEEGSDGEHHGFGAEHQPHLRDGANDAIVFDDKIVYRLLEDHQVGLIFQRGAYRLAIQHTIRLRAGSAHRRTFAAV